MDTLSATIGLLRKATSQSMEKMFQNQTVVETAEDLSSISGEIERMAETALYLGSPLEHLSSRKNAFIMQEDLLESKNFPIQDHVGLEILEGRFESTNEKPVSSFSTTSQSQRFPTVDWNKNAISNLKAEFAASRLGGVSFLSETRVLPKFVDISPVNVAIEPAMVLADRIQKNIVARSRMSMNVQANTSKKIVKTLLF